MPFVRSAVHGLTVLVLVVPFHGCRRAAQQVGVPGVPNAHKTVAASRAVRRAFDGAPPVIPHQSFGADCRSCHTGQGTKVDGVGFAPPTPHGEQVDGAMRRCRQCHVFQIANDQFKPSEFVGLPQDLRHGRRLHPFAPPVIPHQILLRERCAACHTGPAAREEIRCSHPERVRCRQCHVPATTSDTFTR
ncbi:MAG: hypothetical protein H6836_09365 [Planctomycetes bacterium]|nr:hypothetical protein [Planctomycetota bacterium]